MTSLSYATKAFNSLARTKPPHPLAGEGLGGEGIRHLHEQFGVKPSLETSNTAHIYPLGITRDALPLLC